MNADPQKILVIHFGQMGDVVLGLPAMLAIRKRFPSSEITLLIGRSSAAAAQPANIADEIIIVDRVKMRDGGKLSAIGDILRLALDIRRRRFDLVIDLHSLAETNILGLVAGIPSRLYAKRENRSLNFLANYKPSSPPENRSLHLASRYLEILQPLGIDPQPSPFRYEPDEASVAEIERSLSDQIDLGQDFAAIFPGAGHPSRKWPIERFAEFASRLAGRNIAPLIVLGPEESEHRDEIAAHFSDDVSIIEGLSIPQLIALLSRSTVFVGNDSGPSHIAACSGTPVVLIIDKRAPDTYLPLTDRLAVVDPETIERIAVDDVVSAVSTLLDGRAK